MENAGGFANAVVGVAGVEGRRFEFFAGREGEAEIEGVEASGDADLLVGRFFDADAPTTAPAVTSRRSSTLPSIRERSTSAISAWWFRATAPIPLQTRAPI